MSTSDTPNDTSITDQNARILRSLKHGTRIEINGIPGEVDGFPWCSKHIVKVRGSSILEACNCIDSFTFKPHRSLRPVEIELLTPAKAREPSGRKKYTRQVDGLEILVKARTTLKIL